MRTLNELKLKRDIAVLEVQIAEQRLDFIELIRRARSLMARSLLVAPRILNYHEREKWYHDTHKFFTVEPEPAENNACDAP